MMSLLSSLIFLALVAARSQGAGTPPNLDAAMRGVDPLAFNILYQPNPGIKQQLFNPINTSASLLENFINSFVSAQEVDECVPHFSVERVQNYNEYRRAVSSTSFCEAEAHDALDLAAAWLLPENQTTCNNENNRKVLNVVQFFNNTGGEIFLVTAKCTTHVVTISPFERKVFTPQFQTAIQILHFNSELLDIKSFERIYLEFVKVYGTHFSSSTHMGAKVVFLKRFPSRSYSAQEESSRRQCMLESAYEALNSQQRRDSETTLQHFSRASSEKCRGELQDVNMVAIGPKPKESLEHWALEVKKDPQPIYFQLEKISKWFTDGWFLDPRVESASRSAQRGDLNGTSLYRYFQNRSSEYCQLFFGGVCQPKLKGCGIDSECAPGQDCLDTPGTDQGYECVQNRYGGIIMVGGERSVNRQGDAIGRSAPPDYPVSVSGHTLVLVGSTVYSCGGGSTGSDQLNGCRTLGVNDTQWSSIQVLPWSLLYPSAVTVADDIWFFADSELYIYRPRGSHNKYKTDFPSSAFTSCAVTNGSHIIVVALSSGGSEVWLNKDSTKPTEWRKMANLHQTRISHSCLWFSSEIFVSGGRIGIPDPSITSVEVIDTENFEVSVISSLNEARRGHQMAVIEGKPAVLGGLSKQSMKSIETYNARTKVWETMTYTLQENRSYFGLVQYQV